MVLQRNGTGSATLGAQSGLATVAQPDAEGTQIAPQQDALPAAKFDFINATQSRTQVSCRLTIFDLRGGNNRQRGFVEDSHTMMASSTAETRGKGYAHPPLLTTKQNTITPTTPNTVFWTYFLNRVVLSTTGGSGALAASKLIAETSSTNPALVDLSYTFGGGGACYGLWTAYLNNSATQVMLIGTSGVTDVVSDLGTPPTDVGTNMEANSAGMTGFVQIDSLPNHPFLAACGTTLYYGLGTSAINQTMTAIATGIPAGRQGIGFVNLGGRTGRIFWSDPIGVTSIATVFNATGWPRQVMSTNPYGTDPKPHDMGLEDVRGCQIIRDGIVGHSANRVNFYDGEIHPLKAFTDRTYSSTKHLEITGLHVKDKTDLIIDVCEIANVSTGTTNFWQERYDWDLKTWSQISASIELTDVSSTTGYKAARGSPSLPFGQSTRYLHSCGGSGVTTAIFMRKYEPTADVIPYSLRGVQSFESTASIRTPGFIFPAPVTYAPKVCTAIYIGGDGTGGATSIADPGALKVEIGEMGFTAGTGVKAVWDSTVTNAGRARYFPQNQTRLLNPQAIITMTQGADATLIPQPLPITAEFNCFLEEKQKRDWLPWR